MQVFIVSNVFNHGDDLSLRVFSSRARAEAALIEYVTNGFCNEDTCPDGPPATAALAAELAGEFGEWLTLSERAVDVETGKETVYENQ
jgi:hypothetical protein